MLLEAHEPEQIRWLISLGYRQSEIARFFGTSDSIVCRIKTGDRTGTGVRKTRPLLERLLEKTTYDHGCWNFTGRISPDGYGRIAVGRVGSGHLNAHRAAWICLRGPLTSDQHVDHMCRNRKCINPDHLEPVSFQENIRRGRRA